MIFYSPTTIRGLFRETQQHLLELTLWERILKVFIKLLQQLVEILNIDIEETMETIIQNDKKSKQLLSMLNVLKDWDNPQLNAKNAA